MPDEKIEQPSDEVMGFILVIGFLGVTAAVGWWGFGHTVRESIGVGAGVLCASSILTILVNIFS